MPLKQKLLLRFRLSRKKANNHGERPWRNGLGLGLFLFLVLTTWSYSGSFQILSYPPKIQQVQAAVGDTYVARAPATSLITLLDGTENTLTYDTEVTPSSAITRQSGNQAFRIQETGRYLIIANTSFNYVNINNNNRHVVRTQIKVGGSVLPSVYGMASGYGRDSGSADEDGAVVAAYIDHTVVGDSSDDITVHVQNFGDTSVALADQISDQSGIQIIRLPDDADYLKVKNTTGFTFTGTIDISINDPTWTEFGWTTQDIETDSAVIEWVSGNDITLKSAGHYMVIYSIRADSSNRKGAIYRLKLSDIEIPASRVFSYMRGSDGAVESWVQWAGIVDASSSAILNIDWGPGAEAAGGALTEATMTVVKLPDTADYIRIRYDSSRAGETTGVYPFNQEDEDDDNAHDNATNNSRISGTSSNHDWLLFGSWFLRNVTSDNSRTGEHFRWFRTASEILYGSGLSYTRGDQGSSGVPAGGRNAIVTALNLGVGEYIELNMRSEAVTGNQSRDFVANQVGITGVALDTLVPPVAGTLTTDIVNASYVSVGSPTMAMSATTFSFPCQTATGSLGTASEQLYVDNDSGANNGWTLTIAADATTSTWASAGTDYDFNDPTGSGCTDGADSGDSVGGQMTIDPSVGTLAVGQCGACTTTNVTKGGSASFNEGVTDTITLLTATAGSDDIGDWTLQSVGISQEIPSEQPAASDYNIDMVLTVTAS